MKYSIILAVCVAFSLVGCGQKTEEKEHKKWEKIDYDYKGKNW